MSSEPSALSPDSAHWKPGGPYWHGLDHLLRTAGPLSSQLDPAAADQTQTFLRTQCKLLIIGAGGLGCELLKDAALSGFRQIHVIDMDTIDVTNLNRQFLFRSSHVSQPKATVAASQVMASVPSVHVVPHYADITTLDKNFYAQFNLVIAGLDSIDARRWLNAMLLSLVQFNPDGSVDQSSVIPLIDGGTEGFLGHARVIIPRFTSCFECTLSLFPPPINFPLCTIANTPRLPEHCIEYVRVVLWDKLKPFGDIPLDSDDPQHTQWLYDSAQNRARQFGIRGVTYRLTQGVAKNIIPAVASTNAIIAAACTNEALKMVTCLAANLDNYMMYNATSGVYTFAYASDKRPDCPVCGTPVPINLSYASSAPLSTLVDQLATHPEIRSRQPLLRTSTAKTLYAAVPPALNAATAPNLAKPLKDLVPASVEITLTDKDFPVARTLIVTLTS